MTRLRIIAATTTFVTASVLGVSPAWAAAPTNDTSAGATAASDGFTDVVDTTEATTDAEDAQFNESCGFLKTDASVWYTIEGRDTDMVVDSYGSSNYGTATLVGVGSPGSLQAVTCSFGYASFYAEAGTTYYVLVIDPQFDETNNGGTLHVSVRAVPAPTIELTVNAHGTASKRTGIAHIKGTYTCTHAPSDGAVHGPVTQTIKQRVPVTTTAFFLYQGTICDGVRHTWESDVIPPEGGAFRSGVATVEATAGVCAELHCAFDQFTQRVKLAGVR